MAGKYAVTTYPRLFIIGLVIIGTLLIAGWFFDQTITVQAVSEELVDPVVVVESEAAATSTMLSAGVSTNSVTTSPPQQDSQPAFENIQERMTAVGVYDFAALVEQTFIPRASAATIGQTAEHFKTHISGKVTGPQQAKLNMRLSGGKGINSPLIQLQQNGAETYLIEDGERTLVENPTGFFASPAAQEAYLATAVNIRIDQTASSENVTVYKYDIDGPGYAAYMRDLAQAELPVSLRGGQISPSPILQRLSGQGEIWVDANGLPTRQILDIHIPKASDNLDLDSHMVLDYKYDPELVAALPPLEKSVSLTAFVSTVFETDSASKAEFVETPVLSKVEVAVDYASTASTQVVETVEAELVEAVTTTSNATPQILFTLAIIVALLFLLRNKRVRHYAVPLGLSLIFLLTPALHIAELTLYDARTAHARPLVDVVNEQIQAEQAAPQAVPEMLFNEPEAIPPTATSAALSTGLSTTDPAVSCGDGDTGTDTDQDTLSDFVENCLGTDALNADTDYDLIPDNVEVNGFMYGGQQWYSNPNKPDSNADGIQDGIEWAAPHGEATAVDLDSDGLPNLWDDDDDGDGIRDTLDLDPFSVTGYKSSFKFVSQKGGSTFAGYQYIELQIQPEDMGHMAYSNNPLNWPNGDEEGTLLDADNSSDDIYLAPYLRVNTQTPPSEDLLDAYNIGWFKERWTDNYTLYLPLSTINDGGEAVGFYAKIAYDPDALADISWDTMKLIWMAQMFNDEITDDGVETAGEIINEYEEDAYRLASLKVTMSDDVKVAWFGTPNTPNEDRDLFNMLLGMNAAFLGFENPNWQTVVDRFSTAATPITETWGVPAADVVVASTTLNHLDEISGATSTVVPDLLTNNGYPMMEAASLIVASEQDAGWYSLDDMDSMVLSGNEFSANLTQIPLHTMRTLNLAGYEYDSGWEALTGEDYLDAIMARYDDLSATLADLQTLYPGMEEADLRVVLLMLYGSWYNGHVSLIRTDGQLNVGATADDTAITNRYGSYAQNNETIGYLVNSLGFGEGGGGFVLDTAAGIFQYMRNDEDQTVGYSATKAPFMYGLVDEGFYNDGKAFSYGLMGAAYVFGYGRGIAMAGTWLKVLNFAKATVILTAVILVVQLGFAWYNFYQSYSAATNDYERDEALGYALMYTFVTILFFALAVTGVGLILVGLVYLAEAIAYFGFGVSILETVYSIVATADDLTKINDLSFTGASIDLRGGTGIDSGSTLVLEDSFIGEIVTNKAEGIVDQQGTSGDLYYYSRSRGYYTGSSNSDYVFSQDDGYMSCHYHDDYNKQHCQNNIEARFKFKKAKINMLLKANVKIWTQKRVWVCQITDNCSPNAVENTWPDDMPSEDRWDPIEIVVDVIPDTVAGLWNWNELSAADRDGDGLAYIAEFINGTSALDWDSDDDGLGDGFEIDVQESYGTKPTVADSDLDGLLDGQEFRAGLSVSDNDTDSDGLTDGAEMLLWNDNSSTWSSGGWFVNIDGQDYWVFSNALAPDWDGDGLNDAAEASNGTSPNAYNAAPRLWLSTMQDTNNPTGSTAVFLGPNDPFTARLDLLSTGPTAITTTLSLCFPAGIANIAVTPSGDSVPTTQTNGACREWDFSSDNLLTGETFAVDIAATGSMTTSAAALTVALSYPVDGAPGVMGDAIDLLTDADNPTVFFSEPADGILLGNGMTHFVLGGGAADATTWVDHVAVTVPGGTYTATGTAPWAYTWELPADGVHNLSVQSVDFLGNVSSTDTRQVMVDNTGPTAVVSFNSAYAISSTNSTAISITMQGSATDNLSGLQRVQMSLNGRPWRTVWTDDSYPLTANWSGAWTLANSDGAQGKHDVRVRAFDKAGNIGPITEGNIVVDLLAPTTEMTNRAFLAAPPSVAANQALDLYGVANDAGRNPLTATPRELAGTLDSINDATILLQLDALTDDDNGVTLSWIGDFNGDRLADLAVGLPAAANGAGEVVLVEGAGGDWAVPRLGETDYLGESRSIFTGAVGAGLGSVIAYAGDVNGDGLGDMLVGDPANNRVFLVRGRVTDLPEGQTLTASNGAQWLELLPPAGMTIGTAVASAGDVNGDTLDDFLIGASDGANSIAYLILGDLQQNDAVDISEFAAAAISMGAGGALSVSGVGDVDDDEIDDFAVGFGGLVYLFKGSEMFAQLDTISMTLADAADSFAGSDAVPTIVPFGDLNNDDIGDFGFTSGAVPQVVLGSAGGGWSAQGLSLNPAASGILAAGGDVDRNGHSDILVGNADGDLFVIGGENLSAVDATIENVRAVASAPYTRGGDLNADDAADIVVMPSDGGVVNQVVMNDLVPPHIQREWLPRNPSADGGNGTDEEIRIEEGGNEVEVGRAPAALLHVDDDYCDVCANDGYPWGVTAFADLQTAVNTAAANDTIRVHPGVYPSFTVSTDGLTIDGVMADAVFVDGGGGATAVTIDNAIGVTLQDMTIRNADILVNLLDAGFDGWYNNGDRIQLNRVLLQNFTTHAVAMTDDSTIKVDNTTMVGTTDFINMTVDGSWTDTAFTQIITDSRVAVGNNGGWAVNSYQLFFVKDNGSNDEVNVYEIDSGSWTTKTIRAGGAVTSTAFIAQQGEHNALWALRPSGEGYVASLTRYPHSVGGTTIDLDTFGDEPGIGATMSFAANYHIHMFMGETNDKFYRYVATPTGQGLHKFKTLAAPPGPVGEGSAITSYGYGFPSHAFLGNGAKTFCIWDAVNTGDTGTWDCSLAELPETPGGGSALASGGDDYWEDTGYLYAVPGGGSQNWYRYDKNGDSWQLMPPLPIPINDGGGMLKLGDFFYFMGGGSSDQVWRYGPTNDAGYTKFDLANLAIVTEETTP
ncbi:MAG: hypothetical protein KDE48_20445, partial [Anaerolineales bacterium]|nr:hypothetical protein [Anaerolineales bacterium]